MKTECDIFQSTSLRKKKTLFRCVKCVRDKKSQTKLDIYQAVIFFKREEIGYDEN